MRPIGPNDNHFIVQIPGRETANPRAQHGVMWTFFIGAFTFMGI